MQRKYAAGIAKVPSAHNVCTAREIFIYIIEDVKTPLINMFLLIFFIH